MKNEKDLFEEIFRKNKDQVYRLCCMYTGDVELRKDLMQDVFIRVWENMGSFRGEAAMSTWIFRIALNTCLTQVRSLKRGIQVIPLKNNIDFAEEVHNNEENSRFEFFISCVNQLPAFDRMLITLYLEDLTGKEIAEITGLTEANVRVKIHRIKEFLSSIITNKKVCHEF